jgi:hypothetical protein
MKKNTTVLNNLLSHLDRSGFEKSVKMYNGDKGIRKLSCFELLKMGIYANSIHAFSVREITHSMAANSNKLYHNGLKAVARSTFCDALEKRDCRIFENSFYQLVEKAKYLSASQQRRFRMPLKIIDGTVIDLCLSRFDWAKFRTTKGAVKLHVCLHGDSWFPEQVFITDAAVHETQKHQEFRYEEPVIEVFDRGYVDYNYFYQLELQRNKFVTRLKKNAVYETLLIAYEDSRTPVRQDTTIRLNGVNKKDSYPGSLRKITYFDEVHQVSYEFLTNNFDMPAEEIAEIYRSRWAIELFFKWAKQNLKLKTFFGTSRNAVYSQIWIALILFMLLWIHKTLSKIPYSLQRIMQGLKTLILDFRTLETLFIPALKPPDFTAQLLFRSFYD